MAIEAISQRARSRAVKYTTIDLRDVTVSQALMISEAAEVETMLTLKPLDESTRTSSQLWDEFKVFSWTADRGWIEHCRGQIAVFDNKKRNEVDGERVCHMGHSAIQDQVRDIEAACVLPISSQRIYEAVSNIGIEYGSSMAEFSNCRVGENHAVGSVRVPDTTSMMPRQFEPSLILHPAFLDNVLQMIWPLMGAGQVELEGLFVPTFIKNLSVRASINIQSGDCVRVLGTMSEESASERIIESIIAIDPNEAGHRPMISFDGVVVAPLSDIPSAKQKKEKPRFLKIHWQPCLDLLGPEEFQDNFSLEPPHDGQLLNVRLMERAALYYYEAALGVVTDTDYHSLQSHHKKFYLSMQKQLKRAKGGNNPLVEPQWDDLRDSERRVLLQKVRSLDLTGEFLCRLGENIPQILVHGLEPLPLMLENDLLERQYRQSAPLARNYIQAAMIVDNIAHENPHLRVLEIGAGTGGATLSILETLGGDSAQPPRFQEYIFTDISTGFFENSKLKLKAWGSLVTFNKLNIEEDPVSQGYQPESFDLIVAANVLHATPRMAHTMNNVRKLLKLGGKLLLIEATTLRVQFFPFSLLPGWWAGEAYSKANAVSCFTDDIIGEEEYRSDGPLLSEQHWDSLLKETGFSGVDRSLPDYPGKVERSHTMMLSTAIATERPSNAEDLIIVHSHKSGRLCLDTLCERLKACTGETPKIVTLTELTVMNVKDSHCIFLDELLHPMLADISATSFQAVQKLCSASGVLWVVQGAQVESTTPESSMAIGLARCIRSENPDIRLVTLDMDEKRKLSAARTSEVIADLYHAAIATRIGSDLETLETEYLERDGLLHFPRVIQDPHMEQLIHKATHKPVPEYQAILKDGRALSLKIQTLGFLDTFYFAEEERTDATLKPDAVEIQVKASALNFRDVMAAMGKIPFHSFGTDCAGIIVSIGSNVSGLRVGDRVCALSSGAFSTMFRCAASCVVQIPDNMGFEVGASLPTIFCTAYHALVNVAGLSKGESILIHAASGGVGQAAIMLSQSIGADIYVTVGNAKKKEFLMSQYGIHPDHVFFSRDLSFQSGIMNATRNKGVDVVLNSLSGDALRATWRCVAHFGRFVEIGKSDLLANGRLEMEPFIHNRTYTAVDLLALSYEKPQLMKSLLLKIVDLYSAGIFQPVCPITTFPFSGIEKAFRTMVNGDNIGKIVLLPRLEDHVKVNKL